MGGIAFGTGGYSSTPSLVSTGTGRRMPPKPMTASRPAAPKQQKQQNTAWQIPRGEMDQLLRQYATEVGSVVPDMGGMTYDDIAMALGLTGGAPTTGGGGGGVRRAAAVPRWSQADVDALVAGGQQTASNVGGAWDAARGQLQQLMAQYAAADAARRAGAQQTLGAFGAPTQLDVGGMGAGDVLSALLGQASVNKAAEQANLEAMINNYRSLVGQVK
jgi:hypothetical protein